MKKITLGALALLLTLIAVPSWAFDAKEQAAIKLADAWLGILDKGQYGESWDQSASYVKSKVTRPDWSSQMKSARDQVGKVTSRKVDKAKYFTQVPNAPPGEYVIISYQTDFKNKPSSVETVSTMKDKDGKWRVAGYFIR